MKVVSKGNLLKSYMGPKGLGKLRARSDVGGSKSAEVKSDVSGDVVEISSTAKEVTRLRELVQTMPEERVEKVEQIRQMVQNGTYKIEPEKIAEKMIQHAIDLLA